jgi:hypothetical protein
MNGPSTAGCPRPTRMPSLHIIAISTGNEPHAIRSAAEYWGFSVTATWVGNSSHVVDDLAGGRTADIIVIAGHGDEGRLCLPELDKSIAARYPFDGFISADEFGTFVKLAGGAVISLCCSTGTEAMGRTFLDGGASAYIGPEDYPAGNDALKFVLDFLFAYGCRRLNLASCFEIARTGSPDGDMFKLFAR